MHELYRITAAERGKLLASERFIVYAAIAGYVNRLDQHGGQNPSDFFGVHIMSLAMSN